MGTIIDWMASDTFGMALWVMLFIWILIPLVKHLWIRRRRGKGAQAR